MVYLVAYVISYCFSVYWMQRDWRKEWDLDRSTLAIILLASLFLTGVILFLTDIIDKIIDGDKTVLSKYKSR